MHASELGFKIIYNISNRKSPMGQFKALVNKNWIMYRRNIVGSILQLAVPVIFILFTLLTRHLATVETYSQKSNLSDNQFQFNLYGDPVAAIAGSLSTMPTILKQCPSDQVVALVPTNDPMVLKLQTILVAANYQVRQYDTDSKVDQIIRDKNYGVDYSFCFGVSFQNQGNKYKYNLRFNMSTNDVPSTQMDLTLRQKSNMQYYYQPLSSGMIGLTTILNNLILQVETGSTSNMLVNKIGIIYQQQSFFDPIFMYFGNSFQFVNLFPLLLIFIRQTSFMLEQKEKKIRESMSIAGMKMYIYYFTWFIRYFIIYLLIHLFNSFIFSYAFPRVPYYYPLIIYLLFDAVLIIQSFFIQIFVTRSKIGIIFALLFFTLQFAFNYAVKNNSDTGETVLKAIAIVPHIAYILAFKTMIYAESVRVPVTMTALLNKYTIITSVISLLGNIVFWIVLTWYLDQVFPNQWGAKKGICFCFDSCKKKKIIQIQSIDLENSMQQFGNSGSKLDKSKIAPQELYNAQYATNNIINIERQNRLQIQQVQPKFKQMQQNEKALIIRNLTKTYDDENYAVKDLSVTMYSDQIFALLGHNGAGKTSTISMLTGMIEPTSGLIEVLGKTELNDIREKLGVCPQHDTLYDQLTVEEHIRLFATFRNLEGDLLQEEVNKLIKDVNLEEKRNQYAKNLSGGQKRRLSVAMAFSGGSKVIILDEPTSGMDTSARRWIWEMLKNYKNDRIIILTTHFMDEADYLGDRIAIMAQGKLMALGSNVFLKNKFGVGYNITFVKTSTAVKSENIFDCIKKHVPNAKILTDVSSEISIQLPLDKVKHFSSLFAEIDSKKQQLGFQSYGISITTLQEVFLKVGEEDFKNQQPQNTIEANSKLALMKNESNLIKSQSIYQAYQQQATPKIQQDIFEGQAWQREDNCCQRFFSHMGATILKRLRVIRRDIKSFVFELILPMVIIVLALMLMKISFIHDLAPMDMTYDIYLKQQNPVPVPIGAASADSALLDSLKVAIDAKHGSSLDVAKYLSATDIAFDKDYLYPLKLGNEKLRGAIYYQPTTVSGGKTLVPFTSIMNTRSPTSCVTVQTLAAEAYINYISSGSASITPVNKPFPITYKQQQVSNAISGLFGGIIFSIALAFKFASIVAFIVKERQDRCKHQQIVCGLNLVSYWSGNYLYDLILYLIVAGFSVGICWALQVDSLTKDGAFTATCLLFGLFGFSNIALTYILSNIFKDYGNAQGVVYFFNFVGGGIVPIIILILRWIGESSNKIGRGIGWGLRSIPAFAFGEGLINIGSTSLFQTFENNGQKMYPMDMQIALAPIIYLVVSGCLFIALIFIIESLQTNQKFMRKFTSEDSYEQSQPIEESDVLQQQKKAIQAQPEQYEILTKQLRKVYILDSEKKYKVAVDNLSFGVKKGEVFGLLGVNGAGKSTTFKMLAGEIVSTSGDAYFMGMMISENLSQIRKSLGYCPQFDALIENLTVRQQLQLYYDMKCLPQKFKKAAIDQKIKQLSLSDHENKLSGALSGGNKRKLSVAMAMIGNPNILFLDEPSTGMDPKARRFMWKVISRISTEKKQSTVILTTHSMEEAQALSTRLGIMVNGNFKCIGTPQHIKSKYGKGFEIEIKVKPITKEQVSILAKNSKMEEIKVTKDNILETLKLIKANQKLMDQISKHGKGRHIWNEFQLQQQRNSISINKIIEFNLLYERVDKIFRSLKQLCGEVEQIQNFDTYIRYKTGQNVNVSKLFDLLQSKKSELNISQYSIKQATVEQIFNKFAEEDGNGFNQS